MDFHPLIIHFPIALLTLYSFLELIRRFTKGHSWWVVRAVLVIAGTLSGFVALSTGEEAEHLFGDRTLRNVLEAHSLIGSITIWLYTVLAVSYLLVWLEQSTLYHSVPKALEKLVATLRSLALRILRTPIAPILAILGFLGLTFTGALGAILVYGPEFDPITSAVYNLLFGQ